MARYCLTPGCPETVTGRRVGYCRRHEPPPRKRTGNPKPVGWYRLRRQVLSRARYRCEWPGCGEPANEVDHVVPRARGGSDDPGNLRALCVGHHAAKSESERLEGMRWRRSAGR